MQPMIVIMNFGYAIGGGLITLAFMYFGYKCLDHLTPFDTGEELSKGNRAVGQVVGSIFIGIGVAIGLVIGLGLN
ncbi:MAG TPA: DUF350 domain-containing protein [Deltaproteobacteria bacterium]|nr:DUF350 domain-containing protein [Candidatus Lambdaproteobacteria bacterium]HIL14920.1 DUF350 domain-containing protein [Deltaproteobacteria bacterium]